MFAAIGTSSAATLDAVTSRGQLVCGVSADLPGFATEDRYGAWSGIDVEFCRAVATAVLGDPSKVRFEALTAAEGFRSLQSGMVDLLARGTAWTLSRDTEFKVRFVDVLVYDGQGFMVPRNHGVASILELSGASICVVSDTRAADTAATYFGRQRMRAQFVTSEKWQDLVAAYASGGCTALTGELTMLADVRRTLADPTEHTLLPELISKEPIGPAVRIGDERWFSIVRWVLMALIEAEELDVSSANVSSKLDSPIEDVRRLLGVRSDLGVSLGLTADWARNVIAKVGNYGEIYDRTLGLKSPLQLPRGPNNLWTRGGLMYAVPLR